MTAFGDLRGAVILCGIFSRILVDLCRKAVHFVSPFPLPLVGLMLVSDENWG